MRSRLWLRGLWLMGAALAAACGQLGPSVVPTATYTYLPTLPPSPTPELVYQLTYFSEPEPPQPGTRLYGRTVGCLQSATPCVGEPELLFQNGLRVSSYQWSPDGERLAYSASVPDHRENVFVADLVRQKVITIASGPDIESDPVWSPDGASLAYLSCVKGDCHFVRVKSDGTEPANLLTGASAKLSSPFGLSWSPAGEQIVFRANATDRFYQHLYWVNLSSQEVRQLTNVPFSIFSPALSPDGQQVAFVQSTDSESMTETNIWLVQSDGTDATNLTDGNVSEQLSPAWSPASDWIAFDGLVGTGDLARYDLFLIASDGTRLTNLTETINRSETEPAWRRVPAP